MCPARQAAPGEQPQLRVGFTTNNFGRIDLKITSADDRPITLTRVVINKRFDVVGCDFNSNRLAEYVGNTPLEYGDYVTLYPQITLCGAPMHFLISTDKGDTVFTDR